MLYESHNFNKTTHRYNKGCFILYDLNEIIKLKLQNSDFCKALLKGILNRSPENIHQLSRITEGRIIRYFRKQLNVLYPRNHLSYTMYFNGVAIWKSGLSSLFPIYIVVNELELEERYSSENILFIGCILQEGKPKYGSILTSFN